MGLDVLIFFSFSFAKRVGFSSIFTSHEWNSRFFDLIYIKKTKKVTFYPEKCMSIVTTLQEMQVHFFAASAGCSPVLKWNLFKTLAASIHCWRQRMTRQTRKVFVIAILILSFCNRNCVQVLRAEFRYIS